MKSIIDPTCPFCESEINTDYDSLCLSIDGGELQYNDGERLTYTCPECKKQSVLEICMVPEFEALCETCEFGDCMEDAEYFNDDLNEWRCGRHLRSQESEADT